MKTRTSILLAALALQGACTHAPPHPSPPAAHAPAAREEPPAERLVLSDLRVLREGKPYLTLYRSGLLTQAGDVLGTLHASGTFVDLGGTLRITMAEDGTIVIPGGTLVLSEDGTATVRTEGNAPQVLHFDAEGRVVGTTISTRVEGITPSTRRTAMFALLLPDLLRTRRPALIH